MLSVLLQPIGIAAWCMVFAGFTIVTAAALAGPPPRPRKLPFPTSLADQHPTKMTHSHLYSPPPYRLNYRTNRRRI